MVYDKHKLNTHLDTKNVAFTHKRCHQTKPLSIQKNSDFMKILTLEGVFLVTKKIYLFVGAKPNDTGKSM